jgi:NAD(P)-dependent dehydrogenase (short-subunit alcohol dehydrogenase family)
MQDSNGSHKMLEKLPLLGRTAFVTGAAGKLGLSISQKLSELGAELILTDHPGASIKELRKILNLTNNKHVFLPCDLSSEKNRNKLIKQIKNEKSSLNCLINNASIVGSSKLKGWSVDFQKQSLNAWRKAFEINLTAPFQFCRDFLPLLKKGKGANIINITSIYGETAPDWRIYRGTNLGNPAAYALSKAGLAHMTRWLATTLAPQIRVNAIAPGGIKRSQPMHFIKNYIFRTPLHRMAHETDIMGAIELLATDSSSYITGQVIKIDGGWTSW